VNGVLTSENLSRALKIAPPQRFSSAVVTRFVFERFRSTLTSTIGARLYGGRWNPKGVGALYASFERETALAEFTRGIALMQPIGTSIMGSIIVNVDRVADFTNALFRTTLGVDDGEELTSHGDGSYRLTQHLGALAHGLALDGLVVPSAARSGGKNLVLFSGQERWPSAVVTAVR
jgi:RES domain-containing protein